MPYASHKHKSSCPWLRIFFVRRFSLLPMARHKLLFTISVTRAKHVCSFYFHSHLSDAGGGVGFCAFALSSKHIRPYRFFFRVLSAPFTIRYPSAVPLSGYVHPHVYPHYSRLLLLLLLCSRCSHYCLTTTGRLLRPPRPLAYGSRYAIAIRLIFGWRFASPVRHIRSLAQCFFADKKSVFMTDKRHSIYVFFDICKITYLATFSAPILQRFQRRKTLHFMH